MIAPGTVTTVTVTADHIKRGKACQSAECPIALAIIDQGVPPGQHVGITSDTARIWEKSKVRLRAHLPLRAQAFIDDFDDRGPGAVAPFFFELTWEAAS